ncbi:M67 family metallopeptidase [Novosphingobium sp.]|uniref:M67 family metallopeptidase n=1 Tax=Novosphingobium sp. TaxID=1874826 RepID=UPI00286BD476|nr:M67 family metallopeptidase [Novosphingobium sp.]
MVLTLTSGTIATLIAEAARAHPRECCGLLLGQGERVALAQPTANVHPRPERHFEIDPGALIGAHRAARGGGLELLGYYHSHPNGLARPSATDAAQASGDGRIWAIVAAGSVSWWRDTAKGFEPLPTRLLDG